MIALGLWLLVLGVSTIQAATITQTTAGWCSPAVGQTQGNVTITCQGVDPKALARLNELLDKKDLELQEKIHEAEDWTRKYQEVSQRLADAGQDDELARQARTLLREGKLEEAGTLLDRLIAAGEARIAAYHFDRAEVFALQFQPLDALPHYEKAYRFRLDNRTYAHTYASALQHQNRHPEAEHIYQANLKTLREVVQTDAPAYLPDVAMTLNNLAVLYSDTQRLKEAEEAYQEALGIRRQLAQANAPAYLPHVATTLNNLATLYSQTQRLKEAEEAYQEALGTYRQLAKANAPSYLPDVAMTLNNLAVLYRQTQRFKEAEEACQEALGTYRQLAKANAPAYLPDVAMTLNNLAILYRQTQRLKEAEEAYQEALGIRRQLAKANAPAYLPNVAMTLNNLAVLYSNTQQLKEAEEAYQEALSTYRQLAKANAPAYLPHVATTLNNLGLLYHQTQRLEETGIAFQEALTINRDLWRNNPTAHGDRLARSLAGKVLFLEQEGADALARCALLHEAATVAYSPTLQQWAQVKIETSCRKEPSR